MIKRYILFLFLFIASFQLLAQLWIPGTLASDISYTISCQTGYNGDLDFIANQYRNCSKQYYDNLWVGIYNYPVNFIDASHFSSKTDSLSCGPQCATNQGGGPFYEGIYTKEQFHPTALVGSSYVHAPLAFLGAPPVNGWVICGYIQARRDSSISNIIFDTLITNNSNLNVISSYSRIYPFPSNMIPFYDSSPQFSADAVIYCTAGDTVNYNPGIFDTDGDSFVVYWAPNLGGYSMPTFGGANFWPIGSLPAPFYVSTSNSWYKIDTVAYAPGYSYTNPMPDASFNPNNIAATLDTATGEIYFCCHNPGNYAAAVNVFSYRNGQILSEVHREMFISVFPPDSNHDPEILNAGAPFTDTIFAGDSITIPFLVSDADPLDWVWFSATGFPLDSNLNGTGGCSKPPCAYFSIFPNDSFHTAAYGVFKWQTTCNHTAQYQNSITYTFILNTKDDHCPLHGFGSQNISITVIKPPPLDAAPLHCASVDSFGNVLLSWSPTVDTTGFSFKKYRLWSSDSLFGSYALVDSFATITQSSYFHLGAGANADTIFYFLETVSSCNPMISEFSDTISTIFLNLANSGTGIASLSWNEIRDSSSLSSFYHIYRSIDHQPFVLLDSSAFISYVDTIAVCSLDVSYYVSLGDSSGCISRSNIRTDVFEDLIAPYTVVIDTVSIDGLNHPNLSWYSSPSPDVVAYILYSGGVIVDTIFLDSSYYDLSIVIGSAGICYRVAALDSCGNQSVLSDMHCSLMLDVSVNSCGKSLILKWHHNQDTLLMGYQLFYRENGGSEVLLATLGALDSVFVHSSANAGSSYCYYVQASLSRGRSTSSNRLCVVADFTPEVNYTYLRVATVAGGGLVKLKVLSDTNVAVREFMVQRWLKGTAGFITLATVPYQGLDLWYFDDASASTHQRSYVYRIISVDSCYRNDTSNIGQTILLSSTEKANNINSLQWNYYEDWQAGVDYYLIHRLLEDVEIFPSIIVPESGLSTYTYDDDVTLYADHGSKFCYYIEALESFGNTITNSFDTSFSNLSCLVREPSIYIPTAFHPGGGFNDVFKPEIPFIYGNNYSMLIYNRWGEKLFETTEINQGWDGTFKGSNAPAQAYVYLIKLRDNDGNEIVKTGSFVLIR
ncbi:MAG: gliding motility-associated C-terminal domain-containing protein [Bacteroidales bacterium]|nr:gliding motility-associated C-terminal domain-containing protein [Bacteroidales bacterium]